MRWLELERFAYTPFGTFGRLNVWKESDGEADFIFECFTIEPPWEDNAVGRSCVPLGRYPLKLEFSPRFNRELWELKDVPGRSEAKLHTANRASELNGCIAPGLRLGCVSGVWAVLESATALQRVHEALGEERETYIVIQNALEQGVLEVAA